jgi:protein gp37
MAERTEINYLDSAWNVVTGCTPVSAGCAHCYARRIHDRRHKAYLAGKGMPKQYATPFGTVQCLEDRLDQPLRWRRPRRIGVCFTGDLFHEQVPDEFIDKVFAIVAMSGMEHRFFALTKRAERMHAYFTASNRPASIDAAALRLLLANPAIANACDGHVCFVQPHLLGGLKYWPIENLWLGVSCEDQATADSRIPILLQTPAARRWVSYEPALAAVDFTSIHDAEYDVPFDALHGFCERSVKIDWLVTGGQSGPGARPCDVAWIRRVVEQCKAADCPVWVKQLGAQPYEEVERVEVDEDGLYGPEVTRYDEPQYLNLRSRSGSDPSEWPADLRVREIEPALSGE